MGGRVGGSAGIASYQAAKFAIDGFSRVLQTETAPFGIKVLVVEPSGFAADWAGSSMEVADIPDHYIDTVGAMNSVRDSDAITAGDPARAAGILVRMARRTDLPYHLPLGVNAVEGSIRPGRIPPRRGSQVGHGGTIGRFCRALSRRLPPGSLIEAVDIPNCDCGRISSSFTPATTLAP